ncbi:MAG: DJ-1/PfpI family protein, partial [Clostridia bacterium]|nr:DJ-1/PfpI family protein [Clostridia bacterium]
MMKKVYIFLADGFEDIEGLTVVDLMRRAGIDIRTVSIKDTREVKTSHGISLLTDLIFKDTDFSDGDMLVLPGGM